jgi:hypothetical protein
LICREAHVDGDASNAHLANAFPVLLGPALDGGLVNLESLIMTGPADQLTLAKESGDAFCADYQENMVGFSRFAV